MNFSLLQAVAGEVPSVMGVKLAPPGLSPGRYMVGRCAALRCAVLLGPGRALGWPLCSPSDATEARFRVHKALGPMLLHHHMAWLLPPPLMTGVGLHPGCGGRGRPGGAHG